MHRATAGEAGCDPSASLANYTTKHEEGMLSNARELSGVKLTVKAGLEHFCNRVVLVETDSKVTQAYTNHLGGRSLF